MTALDHRSRRAGRTCWHHRTLPRTALAVFAVVVLAVGLPNGGAGAAKPLGRPAKFDEVIARRILADGAQAVSIAVSRNGQIEYAKAYGVADPRTNEPATTNSRFRLGSITKTLTAVAVMKMVERGHLALDDRVLKRLAPGVVPARHDSRLELVTIRQLLSHTSGLPVAYNLFFGWPGASNCKKAATNALAGALASEPGTTYRYSNLNYCILGLVLQNITGQPPGTAVRNIVYAPLGLSNARAAGTYELRSGDIVHPTSKYRSYMESLGAAGNFVGTARDLVRVADAIALERKSSRLLRKSTVQQMLAKPSVGPGTWSPYNPWYGLGLIVFDQGHAWGHTGTVEGSRSMVLHRDDGVTWAVLIAGRVSYSTAQLRSIMDEAVRSGRY
ncbi:MAG TPA: serine hydrolase domain-containing protein [Acidimicrobiales bacterium]